MGRIRAKLDYSKIAQYLRGIVHFVKKTEVELDKGVYQSSEDEICYKEDCPDREGGKDENA